MSVGVVDQAVARRVVVGLALIVVAALAMAGCSSPEASSLQISEVTWPDGEPHSDLSTSDEAVAIRTSQEQLYNAIAYADFSDPALIAARGYDDAQSWAEWVKDERFSAAPLPKVVSEMEKAAVLVSFFEPLDMERNADGGMIVHGCGRGFYASSGSVTYETWLVTTTGEGTRSARMLDSDSSDTRGCEDVTIPAAERVVPINLNDVGRKSVKIPLPRDYYVKLGVISK